MTSWLTFTSCGRARGDDALNPLLSGAFDGERQPTAPVELEALKRCHLESGLLGDEEVHKVWYGMA